MRQILSFALICAATACTAPLAYAAAKAAPGPFDMERRDSVIGETHDLSVLIAALKKQKLTKDEFETSEQHQARLDAIRLPGNLPLGSTIAIKYHPKDIVPFCDKKYDADSREFAMSCQFSTRTTFFEPVTQRSFMAWTTGMATGRDTGSYIGSNAYGATRRITKRVSYGQGLAFKNLETALTGENENYLRKLDLFLPDVPVDRARALVKNVGVVFIVDLEPPYLVVREDSDRPTLSSPVDFSVKFDYLYVRSRQIWLVDLKSGEVLRRFDSMRNVLPD